MRYKVQGIHSLLLAFAFSQLGALLVSLWANLGVAFGLHPESALQLDWFAPGAALFGAAWWSASRTKDWRNGLAVAFLDIIFWLAGHFYIASRFFNEFLRDGFILLGISHFLWWSVALGLGASGGLLGARFATKRVGWVLGILLLLGQWGAQVAWQFNSFNNMEPTNWSDGGPYLGETGEAGEVETFFPIPDGTTIHLFRFDLKRIRLGLYDADEDDSHPFDDRNATWLGQPLPAVWNKISARDGKAPLCLINGGFFGNADSWIGTHEAPLLENGVAHYNSDALQSDWPSQAATLVWRQEKGQLKPQIQHALAFDRLQHFDGALGGVRVLRDAGRDMLLRPGMGGTTLKCSRTSVAFDNDSLWILSVRDPDGEASSVPANRWEKDHPQATKIQVGGFDVADVQRFWRQRHIPNAVLFDGGESTQIGFRTDKVHVIHSSFHFSRTLGFFHQKPLRMVWPMLPPSEANGGVLNWFVVSEK